MANYTIQDIFLKYGEDYINKHKLSKEQWKVFNAIRTCGTKNLGFHICTCTECGERYFGYNSCRNRHCPMCQNYAKEKWIQKESSYLLNSKYFHIVTTIPIELNEIFLYNKKICYNILFKSTSETILELYENTKWLGATVGITSILHTWGKSLEFHPHIHSIVTSGGLKNNHWICYNKNITSSIIEELNIIFKNKFLFHLKHEYNNLILKNNLKNTNFFNQFLKKLYNKNWVTYIDSSKGNINNMIEYIGRYSFRVAISNERIIDISNNSITFEYKDDKNNSEIKTMTISATEFIRRFLLHVLPNSYTKIKHYGLLSNKDKKKNIKLCKRLIANLISNEFISTITRKFNQFKCKKCGCTKFNYYYNYKVYRS